MRVILLDLGSPRAEINEPLGIEMLAGSLEAHFGDRISVELFSCQLGDNPPIDRIMQADIIGISAGIGTWRPLRKLVEEVISSKPAEALPLLILGGSVGTFASDAALAHYPGLICVRGEGESALCGILEAALTAGALSGDQFGTILCGVPNLQFIKPGNGTVRTPQHCENLDHLPLPRRDLLPKVVKHGGIVRTEASRGCPFGKCKFCSISGKYAGTTWRSFPIEWILQDLERISSAGARSPYFSDEEFIGPSPSRMTELADRIIAAKRAGRIDPSLNFFISTRVNTVLGEGYGGVIAGTALLSRLKEAGLREVFLGLESGSKSQLRRYGKGATIAKNLAALDTLRRLGLTIDVGFIMFDKSATLEDVQSDLDFIQAAGLVGHDSHLAKALRIQPGSILEQELINYGAIKQEALNVDTLSYAYNFEDARVQILYDAYSAWEAPYSAMTYDLQATSRGEMGSEKIRMALKASLGQFRALDWEFLKRCAKRLLSDSALSGETLLSGAQDLEACRQRLSASIGARSEHVLHCQKER